MGKGGYLGGSTVVGPLSGWFTGVGVPRSGAKPSVTKSSPTKPPVPKPKKAAKGPKPADLDALRVAYLHTILDAQFRQQPLPNAPRKARAYLESQVQKAGGALKWARSQPEFEKFVEKKRKKYGGELPPVSVKTNVVGTSSTPAKRLSPPPTATQIEILREDRKRVEQHREAALKTIRECDGQLLRIETELLRLGSG